MANKSSFQEYTRKWWHKVQDAQKALFYYTIFNWRVFRGLYWWQMMLSLVGTFFVSLLLLIVAVEINFLWLFGRMPDLSKTESKLSIASEVYTYDKVLLGKYYLENRTPVEYNEIAQPVISALIATEDIRFYQHYGVDFRAFFSAVFSTLQGDTRGGSTITQQLAKNLFKTRETSDGLLSYVPLIRTLNSKLKEWITAFKLETRYNKREILTMYLNTVDFGNSAYGIRTAARTYYNTLPKHLSVNQAATLIGVLKGTTIYNPILNPAAAKERRNVVLAQMRKYNYITAQEYNNYTKLGLGLRVVRERNTTNIAPYFKQSATRAIMKWCEENGYDLYTDGLRVYTTIDSRFQKIAENTVNAKMKNLQERFDAHWAGYPTKPWELSLADTNYITTLLGRTDPYYSLIRSNKKDEAYRKMREKRKMRYFSWGFKGDSLMSAIDSVKHHIQLLQTGLVSIEPSTGFIKAWVGGIDYDYFTYDHVSQSKRQPGSTFKPIVYTEALEQGLGPCDRQLDAPYTVYYTENGENKSWSPNNSDFRYTYTQMTLRKAMATSRNTITARLMDKLSPESVRRRALLMGIQSKMEALPALGLGSYETTLLEMTQAYCAFMNEGIWVEPQFIARIEDRNGKILYEANAKRKRVMSEETAFLMVDMFRGTTQEQEGTSQALWEFALFNNGNEIGGKTGTSSNYADGWYIGVTKDLVTGTWVGADDHRIRFRSPYLGEASQTALPLFGIYMESIYKDATLGIKEGKFPEPKVQTAKPYGCLTPYIFRKREEDSEEGEGGSNKSEEIVRPESAPAGGNR